MLNHKPPGELIFEGWLLFMTVMFLVCGFGNFLNGQTMVVKLDGVLLCVVGVLFSILLDYRDRLYR
jgi:uncharacterized membrane-anchored protein